MSFVAAALAAAGTFLVAAGKRTVPLAERLAAYLRPARPAIDRVVPPTPTARRLARAGLRWTHTELTLRRGTAILAGAFVGMLLAQGDLFVAGPGRSIPALGVLGGVTGALVFNMWITTRAERRTRSLELELPVVADAVALSVIAGESVAMAIESFVGDSHGIAAEELADVVARYRAGESLPTALGAAAKTTASENATRLYSLLSHAHLTGGRLADALGELARDYRATLSRDLTAEGGRRAIATYAPILALMVPVTLLFLMYPTLVGLRQLASGS